MAFNVIKTDEHPINLLHLRRKNIQFDRTLLLIFNYIFQAHSNRRTYTTRSMTSTLI